MTNIAIAIADCDKIPVPAEAGVSQAGERQGNGVYARGNREGESR